MKQDINQNIKNPYQRLEQIHQGIEDYFECRLTDQQEKQLLEALVDTEYRTPEIEECMALMGFKHTPATAPASKYSPEVTPGFRPKENIIHKSSNGYRRTWIAFAASILVSVLIAVPILIDNTDSDPFAKSDCYAYVDGNKITDEEVVLRMLMEDFGEFDQSINQINADFDSTMELLSQIIEENENPL